MNPGPCPRNFDPGPARGGALLAAHPAFLRCVRAPVLGAMLFPPLRLPWSRHRGGGACSSAAAALGGCAIHM